MWPRSIILLSCSNRKRQGGDSYEEKNRRIASSDAAPDQWKSLLAQRRRIFNLLKGVRGRLVNEDQAGGPRELARANCDLVYGPDLGGAELGTAAYLPAYRRYDGRFFVKLRQLAPMFWDNLRQHPVEILFVSGLYGLLFWEELIQEYDCHLGDYVEGSEPRQTVVKLWTPLLTNVLCDFIEAKKKGGAPVHDVFDMLSDEIYQKAFDWRRISGKGVRVHHRCFHPPVSRTDGIPLIAQVLATHLGRFCEESGVFRNGETMAFPPNLGSRHKFDFEYPRTSEKDKIFESICCELPALQTLPLTVRDRLTKAEASRLNAKPHADFDSGALIVSYTKCIEAWLRLVSPGINARSVGWIYNVVQSRRGLRDLETDVRVLWKLRGEGGAHDGPEKTSDDLENARTLALKILSDGEQIRLSKNY